MTLFSVTEISYPVYLSRVKKVYMLKLRFKMHKNIYPGPTNSARDLWQSAIKIG